MELLVGIYFGIGFVVSLIVLTLLRKIEESYYTIRIFDKLDYILFFIFISISYPYFIIYRLIYPEIGSYIDDLDICEFFMLLKHKVGKE